MNDIYAWAEKEPKENWTPVDPSRYEETVQCEKCGKPLPYVQTDFCILCDLEILCERCFETHAEEHDDIQRRTYE